MKCSTWFSLTGVRSVGSPISASGPKSLRISLNQVAPCIQIENHPCADVFENQEGMPGGMPGYSIPYFTREATRFDGPSDYASPNPLQNPVRYEWSHPLGEIVSSLIATGLTLNWLHEHDATSFHRYNVLVKDSYGMYRWPDKAGSR